VNPGTDPVPDTYPEILRPKIKKITAESITSIRRSLQSSKENIWQLKKLTY
jgi:hypothetical protein